MEAPEGTAARLITTIAKYGKKTGSQEIMTLVGHLMGVYDINSLGGGNLLGLAKPIIKTRGSAKESAVVNTAEMLLNIAQNKAVFDKARNNI